MSNVFIRELGFPEPDVFLCVRSGTQRHVVSVEPVTEKLAV